MTTTSSKNVGIPSSGRAGEAIDGTLSVDSPSTRGGPPSLTVKGSGSGIMRQTDILRKVKPLTDTAFGKFDLLRPPKIRKSGPSHVFPPPSLVPPHIRRPSYVPVNFSTRNSHEEPLRDVPPDELEGYHGEQGVGDSRIGMVSLGGEEERTVRYAGGLVAEVLEQVGSLVQVSRRPSVSQRPDDSFPLQPGITTSTLDKRIHELIVSKNAYPSPLGYQGFPKSVTTSVNNVICRTYVLARRSSLLNPRLVPQTAYPTSKMLRVPVALLL